MSTNCSSGWGGTRLIAQLRKVFRVGGMIFGILAGWMLQAGLRDLNPVLWGRWPDYARGMPTAIACEGSHALVAAGPGALHIVDISHAEAPRRVAGLSGEGGTNTSVRISQGVAVLSGAQRGFKLADVRVPTTPRWAGVYDSRFDAVLDADARRVLLRIGSNQVDVVSIEDIDHPQYLGSVTAEGAVLSARLAGDVAYLIDAEAGLRVLDLSESRSPRLLPVGLPHGNASFEWMEFQDGVLVVYGHWVNALHAPRFAAVLVDVSQPLQPVLLGSVSLPDPPEGAMIRTRPGDPRWLTASARANGEAVLQVGQVVRKNGSLRIEPRGESSSQAAVVDFAFAGDRLALVDVRGTLKVFDITDPATVVAGGEWSAYGEGLDYVVEGTRAYLADGRAGVVAFDLGDPAEPRVLGRYVSSESWKRVIPAGDGTVVVFDGSSTRRRLRFRDNGAVSLLASVDFPFASHAAFLREGFLYEESNGTLAVVDWRVPEAPGKVEYVVDPFWPPLSSSAGETLLEDFDGAPVLVGRQVRKLNLDNPRAPFVSRREVSVFGTGVRSFRGNRGVTGDLPVGGGLTLVRGTNLPFGPVESQRLPWFHPALGGILLTEESLFVSSSAATGAASGEVGHASVEVFRIGEAGGLSRVGGCVLPEATPPPALIRSEGDLLHVAGPAGVFVFQLGATTSLERKAVFASRTNLPPELFPNPGVALGDEWFSAGESVPVVAYRFTNGVVGERLREYTPGGNWSSVSSLLLKDGLLYVMYAGSGVDVYDATSKQGLGPLDSGGPLGFVTDLKVVGNRLMTTGRLPGPGFAILMPGTPENPRPKVVSTLLERVPCFGFAVTNTTAWIAAGAEGLIGVDIRLPDSPRVVGRVAITGFSTNVLVLDGVAYVAARYGGVAAVDVRDPQSPQLIARNGAVFADRLDYAPQYGLVVSDFNGMFSEVQPVQPADSRVQLALEGDSQRRVRRLRATGVLGRAGRIERSGDGSAWRNWRPVPGDVRDEGLEMPQGELAERQYFRFVEP